MASGECETLLINNLNKSLVKQGTYMEDGQRTASHQDRPANNDRSTSLAALFWLSCIRHHNSWPKRAGNQYYNG